MEYFDKKITYLRGLCDGSGFDPDTKEGKIFHGIMDILEDMAFMLETFLDDEELEEMELDEEDRHKLLKELPNELIAKRFVDNMETDDAVDLMRELDEDTQEEILSHIEDVEQAGDIVDLLKYDEDTAGGLMGTEMIVVNENWSMPKCIDEMRKQAEDMD